MDVRSDLSLRHVPQDIEALKHLVVIDDVGKIRGTGCAKLFLARNALPTLPPMLFELENLTVLSLRTVCATRCEHHVHMCGVF